MMKHFRIYLFVFCLLNLLQNTFAQQLPKRELRAAWIATYSNIDWPDRKKKPEEQRADFIKILDQHKATGINVVYVQVRSQADAMYPSAHEPWSADLTGVQGQAPEPYWDPLQFMITEAHKRGIEFHAWINPYRAAGNSGSVSSFSNQHVIKKHPEWLLRSGTKITLNPGLPAVRDHIMTVISDIVKRYDIDGIHFDDYFYPEHGFNDNAAYSADPRGIADRGDWRRDNVNLLIERAYREIKFLKPWVKFGVSPSGIYRNSTDPAIGSATKGMEHYSVLYADSRKWMQEGWVDYIEPQIYWYQGQPAADYNILLPWWNNNAFGRHVYIGLGSYKVESWGRSPWADPKQIPNQLRLLRTFSNQNIKGAGFYNTTSMTLNLLGFNDSLKNSLYRYPALVPSMPWRDSVAPEPPAIVNAAFYTGDSVVLNWQPVTGVGEMDKARHYVIYRSFNPDIDTEDPANILRIVSDTSAYKDMDILPGVNYYYAVSAVDRLYNESAPTLAVTGGKLNPVITLNRINSVNVRVAGDRSLQLDWSTAHESGVSQFVAERSKDGNRFEMISIMAPHRIPSGSNYQLLDTPGLFNAPVYYRIRIIDSVGKESITKVVNGQLNREIPIVRFNFSISKANDMQVGVLFTGVIEYAVIDEERKRITWGKIRPLPVNSQVILPGTKDLPSGNYILNVTFNGMQQNIHVPVP